MVNDIYSSEKSQENEVDLLGFELNVISIGDGIDEKKAVFCLNKNKDKFNFCHNIIAKFIRMIENPSASSIILQLQYLLGNINSIIESDKTLYTMNIEIANGCKKIKCIPKKKKYKIDKVKVINNSYEKNKKKIIINDKDDLFLIKDELEIDLYNFQQEDNLARKCLFLGKKLLLN